ncbi:single-stranded-DNA-specific exonuclease RecJ [Acidipila sp. EB88]|nr:single-stranded-DNA-specific exonuclease RecJ [Acidipila sp. EB88]
MGRPARRWVLPVPMPEQAIVLAQELIVPVAVAELLLARGISTTAEAAAFLHPTIEQLHDPLSMLGMATAVTRIAEAVARAEPILIYGDYDVDGTTAVVLLKTAIERLGGTVRFHVPHRLREGYGMQREVLERAAAEGVRLVVSVDTGIRAFAAADAAEALGLDLIVTDHHLPEAGSALPHALAVLNPNQPGCGYGCKGLCGAGVAFKLSQALLEHAAVGDPAALVRVRTKVLPSFLKMLAIATVADAVPLLGENRAIVALGLQGLREPASPGLRALMEVAQLDPARKKLSAMDVGFRLGPRINAAGRMDIAGDVVELFTTRLPARAQELAAKLDQLNTERRNTEAEALAQVMERLAEARFSEARCLVLDGDGWHRGVIGILASRVVDTTGKPALVIAHENGEAYGSGRSIDSFHLLEALESCAELFTRFGGHAHAVGFSLPSDRVPLLRERLERYAAERLTEADLMAPVHCDAELPLDHVTPALWKAVGRLEPFGMENREPAFVARDVGVAAPPRYMKEKHCKLFLVQGAAQFAALGWNWGERVRGLALEVGERVDLVYRLRENEHPEFGGLELEIVDLRRGVAEA